MEFLPNENNLVHHMNGRLLNYDEAKKESITQGQRILNLEVDEEHIEMFDKWDEVISKIKEKDLDDVDEKELYELKSDSRDFISQVGKDLREMKDEASDIAPDVDPSEVAKDAGDKGMPDAKDAELEDKEEEK